jgi:class 3 adenylate cyclase
LREANYEIDIRHILPAIHVPTLILHRVGDALVTVAFGRYLAQNIPRARLVELPGTDHTVIDNETQDVIAGHIEEFITGERQPSEPDGVLATVMFTDIVGSPQRAAEIGDSRWRQLLDDWYSVFRGREVDTARDGLVATFDGPARGIRCACSMRERVHALGLKVRTGLHTGECELTGDNVVGIAVQLVLASQP